MAKVLILICLLLVATLSKTAPVWDEEVDDEFDDLKDEDLQDDSEDRTGDEEENDNDGDEDKEVEILEDRSEGEPSETEKIDDEDDREADEDTQDRDEDTQDRDEDTRDTDEQDSDVEDDETRGVEDSHGQMTLDKPDYTNDDDDDEEEMEGGFEPEGVDGDEFQDMGVQISKLKRMFNQDMPREIDELKSSSRTLRDDLDNLNAKLENFLRDNGIEQDPAVPQSDSESDYVYN